jgi:tetratricopeptide (TPR) repeat protein
MQIQNWLWHATFALVSTACMAWMLWRWLKSSDEPGVLIVRWIASVIVIGIVFAFAARARDEMSKIAAVLVGAVGGLFMAIIWRQRFCEFVAGQISGLYTGGSAEPDPTPFYSIALGRRKRGQYDVALAEVQKQLERFPNDFTGWMLLAEIHAEDLKDLAAAQECIREILSQPGHAPKNIAFALNREADWHLKLNHDGVGARAALERILELLPDTEQAQLALQRIAHLAPSELLAERKEPRRIQLPSGPADLGLRDTPADLRPVPEDPVTTAANYVRHLEEFPFDNEAREKLALIYARHYQRLDLASDQLEQLIGSPNQPAKSVVHWLNLLADLQVDLAADPNLARQTLERITELYPGSAGAESARNRMAHLRLELRAKQQSQVVKLGSYEENIGLKGGPPRKA